MIAKLNAQHYQANSSTQKRLAEEVLSKHVISPTETILDIGCGEGELTAAMAKIAHEGLVLGVDPSAEMIAFAKRTYKLPNLDFAIARAETSHAPCAYSLITAFSCLHWVKDLKMAFEQMYQALRPDGKLLALTYPKESPYWQPFIEILQRPQWQAYQPKTMLPYWQTSDELQLIIQQAGFSILKWETVNCIAHYATKQAFIDYVKGWLPCLLQADEQMQEYYLHEVLAHVIATFGRNGRLAIPYIKLQITLAN